MKSKTRRTASSSKAPAASWKIPPPAWSDPEIFLFARRQVPEARPVREFEITKLASESVGDLSGSIREDVFHGFSVGDLFVRKREDVVVEWDKVLSQLHSMIDRVTPAVKNFDLEEITIDLGFSAEGHIVFVAKGSVETTISMRFKRK